MTAGLYTPFPITVPYNTRPSLKRLDSSPRDSGQLFVVDGAYETYLEQKLSSLSNHPERYSGLSAGAHEGLENALFHVFSLVANEQPDLVELGAEKVWLKALGLRLRQSQKRCQTKKYWIETSDAPLAALGRRVRAHLEAQPDPVKLAHALALSVQEDIVVVRDLGGADETECLCVTFPSAWDPQEKVGQNFSEVHQPVANNAALLRSHRPVMNALFHKGPFVRFVWGLSADGRLGQHPAEAETSLPRDILHSPAKLAAALFFRTERQVSIPLPTFGRCLFTVRVATQPLEAALCNNERRRTFAAALASMNEELLAYKGLSAWRGPLLAYLNG